MTGLSLESDALIEVAVLVTDAELNILGEGVEVVIKPPAAALEQMGDFVRNMHITSGLITELDAGLEMDVAQQIVMDYIRSFAPEPNKALLAGNSVGTDKNFLARDMPEVVDHLHYRILDVSTLKELARRWYPRVFFQAPAKTGNHRALGDIRDSIDELKYYRATLMVPAPGPDIASAKASAAQIVAQRPAD